MERDNNYVKFYMDNAYEYLNEKNVLLEEAKMLDVEKHKNVGADMKTVNDGSLLDGLSENVSIPESEKVAGGLDKDTFNEHSKSKKYNDILKYSRKLDYKDEKYKIISCDRKGKVDGYDLYLQDEDSEFYNYVEDLQTIKSDSKYKNFNFEFNAERAAKVRELTKPSNAVVEDEDANEDDVELSIKQACFENIIRKMTEQNNGMER